MRGRGAALLLALAMSLTLAACGGKDSGDAGAARLRDHGTSGTGTPARRSRDLLEDGRYYAGGDGVVSDRRNTGTSEWEKLGRDLRESWDKLMDGAEDAGNQLEQDATQLTPMESIQISMDSFRKYNGIEWD